MGPVAAIVGIELLRFMTCDHVSQVIVPAATPARRRRTSNTA